MQPTESDSLNAGLAPSLESRCRSLHPAVCPVECSPNSPPTGSGPCSPASLDDVRDSITWTAADIEARLGVTFTGISEMHLDEWEALALSRPVPALAAMVALVGPRAPEMVPGRVLMACQGVAMGIDVEPFLSMTDAGAVEAWEARTAVIDDALAVLSHGQKAALMIRSVGMGGDIWRAAREVHGITIMKH